jgi:hypothetical protein
MRGEQSGTCGPAAGILSGGLPGCCKDLSAHPVRRAGTGALPQQTPGTRAVTYRWVHLASEGRP